MKKYLFVLMAIAGLYCLVSCASQPLPPPEYTYGKNAVIFHVKADKNLNVYQGTPHTLLLCVYQLSDPNKFNQLLGDEDGLYKLLECQSFGQGVTNVKRFIIQPDQDMTFKLDRAEGTKYVGFVAGYSQINKDTMVRLFSIPVEIEKKGFISRSKIQKPGVLKIDLLLGSQGIEESKLMEKGKK